ncbi:MAG: HemX, putative uroporphyrinogen-III C-methyltransferase [Chromatiaceae bacterium]|nr:HemX, putative uroporphyrinogen-III C-methyltransferase [Chromatiaceae bacterium]
MRTRPKQSVSNGVRFPLPPAWPPAPVAARRRPRRGLWLPALLPFLALLTVIGGIAVGHFYWRDLLSSASRMDETLGHARERQLQMVEHFAEAQRLLLAQQRRLQEQEETLRAREAALTAERMSLEETRARLALAAASSKSVVEQIPARELARRLDLSLARLADPGGLESTAETLDAVADWAETSPLVAGSPPGPALGPALETALAAARDALAAARADSHDQVAGRLERLGADATGLTPRTAGAGFWSPAPGLAGDAGPGHLGEQIQTALFAVRRGDESLFRLALDTAGAWLAAFYDQERPEVAAVQREIAAVRQLPVRRDLDKPRTSAARVRAVLGEMIQRAETAAG